jgi:hypothetical protein
LARLWLASALLAPLVTENRYNAAETATAHCGTAGAGGIVFAACAFISAKGWNRLACEAIFGIAEVKTIAIRQMSKPAARFGMCKDR